MSVHLLYTVSVYLLVTSVSVLLHGITIVSGQDASVGVESNMPDQLPLELACMNSVSNIYTSCTWILFNKGIHSVSDIIILT